MKKIVHSFFILVTLITFTGSLMASNYFPSIVIEGETNTQLGTYSVSELEPETIKGETLRKFELTYENAKVPVLIYLYERPKCKEYIVRSNTMEIKYTCRKSGFGADFLTGKFMMYSPDANARFISLEALEQQRKITTQEVGIDMALGLIASYYPTLLKNSHLL